MPKQILGIGMAMAIVSSVLFAEVYSYQFEPMENPEPLSGFDSLNTRFISNWPFGPSFAVSFDSLRNLAFCGSGGGVYILDVSSPSNPQKVSEGIHTRSIVYGLFYEPTNQRLYIAAVEGGLEIWDVANPSNPVKLGYHFTPSLARGVYVLGSYAYVADGGAGVQIYEFYSVGIEEQEIEAVSGIRLMHNPVSKRIELVIESTIKERVQIFLYNTLGQRIRTYLVNPNKNVSLGIEGLSSDIYFLKLEAKSFTKPLKVVVIE